MDANEGPVAHGVKVVSHTIQAMPDAIPKPHFPEAVGDAFLGAYALLVVATIITFVMSRLRPERNYE
jgi:hypothetical protein